MILLHSAFSHLILLSPRPLNHPPMSQLDVVFVIRPPMRVQGADETLQLWMSHDVTPPCHVTPRPCVTHHMSRGCDCDLIGRLVITLTLDWLMKNCASCHQTQVTIIATSWHVSLLYFLLIRGSFKLKTFAALFPDYNLLPTVMSPVNLQVLILTLAPG